MSIKYEIRKYMDENTFDNQPDAVQLSIVNQLATLLHDAYKVLGGDVVLMRVDADQKSEDATNELAVWVQRVDEAFYFWSLEDEKE